MQGQVAARRNGGPEVFADFDAEGAVGGSEQQAVAERYGLSAEAHFPALAQHGGRGEPALLVKFPVVGEEGFRDNAVDAPFLNDGRTVEKAVFAGEGYANDGRDAQPEAKLKDFQE